MKTTQTHMRAIYKRMKTSHKTDENHIQTYENSTRHMTIIQNTCENHNTYENHTQKAISKLTKTTRTPHTHMKIIHKPYEKPYANIHKHTHTYDNHTHTYENHSQNR